jgi:hypothetical protein
MKYSIKVRLQSQHCEKRGGFSIVIPPEYDVYISQMILYARACSIHGQFLIGGNRLTRKGGLSLYLGTHRRSAGMGQISSQIYQWDAIFINLLYQWVDDLAYL